MADFVPKRILLALLDHGVDFVIIGATAAIHQGAPLARTFDMDVTVATTKANLDRLAAALRELDATLRVPDPDERVDLPLDRAMLATVSSLTLSTRFGPFDILFEPAGAPTYRELRKRSVEVRTYGVSFRAASIEDIVAMKQAAGREKDAAHLTVLTRFLEEQAG